MDDISTVFEPTKLHSESDSEINDFKRKLREREADKASTSDQKSFESQTDYVSNACQIAEKGFRSDFVKKFLQLIQTSEFEFGFNTPADEHVQNALDSYGPIAREWINDLFLQNFDKSFTLSAILRIIAHFDYRQMYPQGMTMATAATRHSNTEVRECGVRCFESWEAPENLNILRNITFEEDWLNDYLSNVISDLEDFDRHVVNG